MENLERPTKRIKINENTNSENVGHSSTAKAEAATTIDNTSTSPDRIAIRNPGQQTQPDTRRKRRHNQSSQAPRSRPPKAARTFSQPSVICTGDKGIFVTCDKGREQKSLLELHDLIQQYLDEAGLNALGELIAVENATAAERADEVQPADKVDDTSIEAEIASELAQLKDDGSKQVTSTQAPRPIQLITLDIPCVSFLRFPPDSTLDPVHIVHKLCLSAADPASPQKSRYVKRLTPISDLAKALSQGLEKICEDVLPRYFGPGEDKQVKSTTFAIRPTIRNNDKLDRDVVIKLVATRIQEISEGQHKVDLKQYERGVLVEVYRGWVGICVVDNTGSGSYAQGFEELKRFNLAEIYAHR